MTGSPPSRQSNGESVPQCEISLKQDTTKSDKDIKAPEIDHESVESTPTVPTRQNVGKLDPTPSATQKPESPPAEKRK